MGGKKGGGVPRAIRAPRAYYKEGVMENEDHAKRKKKTKTTNKQQSTQSNSKNDIFVSHRCSLFLNLSSSADRGM